ncbi:uncharacterized protein LOC108192659 [Daucus carota subsp. sativus]|uniref:uncharacterized protein LOC108192659 n=1 Tax=Daucus carota subsp. sativus TaxID=79200 RepID=UPI003083D613
MDSTAPKKRGLGRGPTQIPRAPTNPDDRELIQLRQTPYNVDFADHRIVKCISQLCLQNWPTPAIRWASTPTAHKDAVWAEFQKRYRWADEDGPTISDLFWRKCADRTKDNLSKERTKALQNASNEFPGQGDLHMHKFNPWWCSADIWAQMCAQWTEPEFVHKSNTASGNRCGGAEKAKGTYKGGSISQGQHMANKESQSQGTINWLDVYVATREGIPAAQEVAKNYRTLVAERYPEGTQPPHIDQELWERASIVKKNYVKGQGQRRRPSIFGSTCSTQSSQSPSHPPVHTPADCVRAICQDRALLRVLGGHLGLMDPDELAHAVAEAAASQQSDGRQGDRDDQDADDYDHDADIGGS